MTCRTLSAQANFLRAAQKVKLRSSGRSHKRASERERDWKREQQRLLRVR
jgi:hypothetical protein